MVASRWPYRLALAASVSFATSASVKYSRVRSSTFGRRRGVTTVRFTGVGDTTLRGDFAMILRAPAQSTVRIIVDLPTVTSADSYQSNGRRLGAEVWTCRRLRASV